jgi:hypothetical protein
MDTILYSVLTGKFSTSFAGPGGRSVGIVRLGTEFNFAGGWLFVCPSSHDTVDCLQSAVTTWQTNDLLTVNLKQCHKILVP